MSRSKQRHESGFTLVELLIVVAIIGIIAAIAIPNLLRARVSANEAQAIGDTRTVMSASATYASMNCGFFAPALTCLTREGGGSICIPGYPPTAPQFLGGDLARAVQYLKSGYQRDYLSRGAAPPLASSCDPGSILDYCYSAFPVQTGVTGVRSFSGGAPGMIFEEQSGTPLTCPPPPGTLNLQ